MFLWPLIGSFFYGVAGHIGGGHGQVAIWEISDAGLLELEP